MQVDDLLKANSDRLPGRPQVGIATRISDAELVTLAVLIADKNYSGRDFETTLTAAGIDLLRPSRKGEKTRSGEQFFQPYGKQSNGVRHLAAARQSPATPQHHPRAAHAAEVIW